MEGDRRHRWSAARAGGLVALVLAAVLSASPVVAVTDEQASDEPPADGVVQTRIIGGDAADEDDWPSMAALIDVGAATRRGGQFCGATVIDPSWILTAAHCVKERGAGSFEVLTGQYDLGPSTGGELLGVREIRIHPNYRPERHDLALLRLDQPTSAPPQTLVAPGDVGLWLPGDRVTVTGWGNIDPDGARYPLRLREAQMPVVADSTCEQRYGPSFSSSLMICAGILGTGGVDACQGDSGGPLVTRRRDGTWVQVGITSWGVGCGLAQYPGVYTELAAHTDWIAEQTRFGVFGSADGFIVRQFLDVLGRRPSGSELAAWRDELADGGRPASLVQELVTSSAANTTTGAVERLYRAYFGRGADSAGLAHWLGLLRRGASLAVVSESFAASNEFESTYGSLSDRAFVELVYENVLGRVGDPSGIDHWTAQLRNHSRGTVMIWFSESPEFRARTRIRTERVILHFSLVRAVPTTGWLDLVSSVPLVEVAAMVLADPRYRRRF